MSSFLCTAQPEEEFPVRVFSKNLGFDFGMRALIQDREDFMWIRLEKGIQRFSGQGVDTFFEDENTYSLIKDISQNVWLSVNSGIYLFNYDSNVFQRISTPDDDSSPVRKLLFASSNGLHYVSRSGLYRYDNTIGEFLFIDSLPANTMSNPFYANEHFTHYNDHIIVRNGDTLWNYNIISKEKTFTTVFQTRNVFALSEEEIIVSNWENKSWYINTAAQKKIPLFTDTPDRFFIVFDVLKKNDHSFYLATYSGLYLFDTESFQIKNRLFSVGGEKILQERYNALYKDADNRIWVSTENSLMYFSDNDNHFHFIKNNSPSTQEPFGEVRAFVEDSTGNLWVATSQGLTFWETKSNTFTTIKAVDGAEDHLNHASIRGLVYDGTYLIIGQTKNGIWLYNPKNKVFKRPIYENSEAGTKLKTKLENDFINQIYTLKNGNHIVAARDGAYLLNGITYELTSIDFSENLRGFRFAYQTEGGDLFFGTTTGLYCLSEKFQLKYHITEGLGSNSILSFVEHNGIYYVGTSKGFYSITIEDEKPKVSLPIPDIENNWISTLFSDKNNRIWIVSFDKIFNYDAKQNKLVGFGDAENVLGNPFVTNSFYQNNQGQVFLGAVNGIGYFLPEKINPTAVILKPKIKYLKTPDKKSANSTIYLSKLAIPYKERNLEAEIEVPYYGNASDIQYKYRLKPEGNWYELGNQKKLMLWELSPGDYQFQVAASVDNRKWYTSEAMIEFTIKPPFWKSTWFIVLLILSGLLILYKMIFDFNQKLKIEKTVNQFATSLYGKNTVEDILWDVARNGVQLLGFEDCVVYLYDKNKQKLVQTAAFGPKNPYGREINNLLEISPGKGIVGGVAQTGIPEIVNNTAKDPRYIVDNHSWASEITVPVWVDGEVFAIIDSEHPRKNFYKKHHLKTLVKIASVCSERISKFLTEENLRTKIARDLHDEMGSTLTSININSKIAALEIEEGHKIRKQLKVISNNSSEMMEKMSDLVWAINPRNDNFLKVIEKIREYTTELIEPLDINLKFQSIEKGEFIKLNPEERKNIYLIAKEAINNAIKYSEANVISIVFIKTPDTVIMEISDNGKGFQLHTVVLGNGIKNMKERAVEISATLEIKSKQGVQIRLTLPTNSVWDYNL